MSLRRVRSLRGPIVLHNCVGRFGRVFHRVKRPWGTYNLAGKQQRNPSARKFPRVSLAVQPRKASSCYEASRWNGETTRECVEIQLERDALAPEFDFSRVALFAVFA